MSAATGRADGVFGSFPYEAVITPATVAGLVIAVAQYLLGIGLGTALLEVDQIVLTFIDAISWIGFLVAVLAIVVSGARSDVLVVGAILTYVAELVAALFRSVYSILVGGGSLQLSPEFFLAQLSLVIIVVGIGIGVNWIGVDVSL